MAEHIVAVYETEAAAAAAEQSVLSIGIPAHSIRRYAGSEAASATELAPGGYTSTHTSGGFWAWLFGEDATSETSRSAYTHDLYDRRAAAGNVVLGVLVNDDAKLHQVASVLEAHDPLDIGEGPEGVVDTTTTGVRPAPSTIGQDFTSSEVARPGVTETPIPSGRAGATEIPPNSTSTEPASAAQPMPTALPEGVPSAERPAAAADVRGSEEVIPLAEEQVEIGKRTVDRGTTRIRRYVVEKPVEESVTLHGERVTVERRQPLETGTPGAGAFEERVVEVRETTEEPVVSKTAHLVEEVVVGREATERTETVKDTVRREEVEVAKDGEVKR
jgi:uncharacterized protein (TIGR02271 family)